MLVLLSDTLEAAGWSGGVLGRYPMAGAWLLIDCLACRLRSRSVRLAFCGTGDKQQAVVLMIFVGRDGVIVNASID